MRGARFNAAETEDDNTVLKGVAKFKSRQSLAYQDAQILKMIRERNKVQVGFFILDYIIVSVIFLVYYTTHLSFLTCKMDNITFLIMHFVNFLFFSFWVNVFFNYIS